jgi:hypothetical protein
MKLKSPKGKKEIEKGNFFFQNDSRIQKSLRVPLVVCHPYKHSLEATIKSMVFHFCHFLSNASVISLCTSHIRQCCQISFFFFLFFELSSKEHNSKKTADLFVSSFSFSFLFIFSEVLLWRR